MQRGQGAVWLTQKPNKDHPGGEIGVADIRGRSSRERNERDLDLHYTKRKGGRKRDVA